MKHRLLVAWELLKTAAILAAWVLVVLVMVAMRAALDAWPWFKRWLLTAALLIVGAAVAWQIYG